MQQFARHLISSGIRCLSISVHHVAEHHVSNNTLSYMEFIHKHHTCHIVQNHVKGNVVTGTAAELSVFFLVLDNQWQLLDA